MTRCLIRQPTAVLALGILTLAMLPQAVLCVGSGGHVAIEPAHASCCTGVRTAASEMGASPECPPHCSDTQIGFSAATSVPNHPTSSLLSGHTAFALGPIADLPGATHQFVLSHWAHPRVFPPRDIRTTVQRC